jgi:hypothetical protein
MAGAPPPPAHALNAMVEANTVTPMRLMFMDSPLAIS